MRQLQMTSFYWFFPSREQFALTKCDPLASVPQGGFGHFVLHPLFDGPGHYLLVATDRHGDQAAFNLGQINQPSDFQEALASLPSRYPEFDFSSMNSGLVFSFPKAPAVPVLAGGFPHLA